MRQQFSHLENSAKITGITAIGPVVRNHISSKMADEYSAALKTTYRSLLSSSSSLTSPTSSSHEAVTSTEHPASTRSESTSEEVGGNSSHDLPEWLEKLKDNLADECVPEHRDASSSSRESASEPRGFG